MARIVVPGPCPLSLTHYPNGATAVPLAHGRHVKTVSSVMCVGTRARSSGRHAGTVPPCLGRVYWWCHGRVPWEHHVRVYHGHRLPGPCTTCPRLHTTLDSPTPPLPTSPSHDPSGPVWTRLDPSVQSDSVRLPVLAVRHRLRSYCVTSGSHNMSFQEYSPLDILWKCLKRVFSW